ncbi:MAG: hypothetical protein LBC61_01645 [Candidatus Peribacteria bacterium]|jgi:hypothetical protein|nr:hypothetical protein [Candidatus Peribacteria bacterium]
MTYLLCIFLSSKEEFIKFLKRILVATLIVLLVVLLVVPLSLLGLLFLIMFIQWLFFSYDDDFNIPENYFDRMYEDKEINSPEN